LLAQIFVLMWLFAFSSLCCFASSNHVSALGFGLC
jgi:hypothetical protein